MPSQLKAKGLKLSAIIFSDLLMALSYGDWLTVNSWAFLATTPPGTKDIFQWWALKCSWGSTQRSEANSKAAAHSRCYCVRNIPQWSSRFTAFSSTADLLDIVISRLIGWFRMWLGEMREMYHPASEGCSSTITDPLLHLLNWTLYCSVLFIVDDHTRSQIRKSTFVLWPPLPTTMQPCSLFHLTVGSILRLLSIPELCTLRLEPTNVRRSLWGFYKTFFFFFGYFWFDYYSPIIVTSHWDWAFC